MVDITYPNICAKHKWRGQGECPSCAGERAADEVIEQAKQAVRTGGSDA